MPYFQKLPRGIRKDDPRIYRHPKDESEAARLVKEVQYDKDKLNFRLKRAAYFDDVLTAKACLETGADPNYMSVLREGPMESMMSHGSVEMLRLMLKHGASLEHDEFGVPPLFYAIKQCRHDLVEAMIEAGADVNAHENSVLKTPLHVATCWGAKCFPSVKLLLSAGADPREVNSGGCDVLTDAQQHQELFGDVDPLVFIALKQALRKWKGKPLPKKPRRRSKTEVEKKADAMGL